MSKQLTAEDARESLVAHVAAKGFELREKYGPRIGWEELCRLLADRAVVRYPTHIEFDAAPLQAGEFAHPVPRGGSPEEGFTMVVHPHFLKHLERIPYLVLYQLVVVNYGRFAGPEDAEVFGAAALGLSRDDYYAQLCEIADELPQTGCT